MISTLQDGSEGGAEDKKLYAIFEDVTGLATKSRIQMSGIPVGQITKIYLEDGKARVNFSIRPGVKLHHGNEGIAEGKPTYINGATLTKKQASLIGDYFLEITPGTTGPEIKDGDLIHNTIEPLGIDQIMGRLDKIAADVAQVTGTMATIFGGEQGKATIQKLVGDLSQILTQINHFIGDNTGKLDTILANVGDISAQARDMTANSSQSISRILRDSEAIVAEVRFMIGQSSGDVQTGLGTIKGTLSRLSGTLDSLNYSLQNVQDITDKVNEGEGTIGELINNPTIAQRTEEILNEAGNYVKQISRLKTIIDLRSEFHLGSSQLKNVLGLRLQPTDDKYYLFELVDDFRGKTEIIRQTTNTNEAGSDPIYTETQVVTKDEFKVSVQFAKTVFVAPWLGVTGRFGLIEGAGGVGINLTLFENKNLEINTDLFDFGDDVNPRLRSFATFRFFSLIYLAAGMDDALNPEKTDYFLGGGIRFNDADLKAILSTTGVPGG